MDQEIDIEVNQNQFNDTLLLSQTNETPSKVEEEDQIPLSQQQSPSFQQSQLKIKDFNYQTTHQQQSQIPLITQQINDQTFSLGDQSIKLETNFCKIFENLQKIEFQLQNQSIADTFSEIKANVNEIKDTIFDPAYQQMQENESFNLSIQQQNTKHMRTRSEASSIFIALNHNHQAKEKQISIEQNNAQEQPKICQCQKLLEIFQQDINNELGKNLAKYDKSLNVVYKYFELRNIYLEKFNEFEETIQQQNNQIQQQDFLFQKQQRILDDLCERVGIQPNDDIINNFMNFFDQLVEEKEKLQTEFDNLVQDKTSLQKTYLDLQEQYKSDLNQFQQQLDDKQKQNIEYINIIQQQKASFEKLQIEKELIQKNLEEKQHDLNQQLINMKNEQIQNIKNNQNYQIKQDLQRISLTLLEQQKNSIYVMSKFFKQLLIVFSKNINIEELLRVLNDCFNKDQIHLKQMINENNSEGNEITQVFDQTIQHINGIQRILCYEYKKMIEEMNRSNEEYFKSF